MLQKPGRRIDPLGDPKTGDPIGTFREDGKDFIFPSCKFRSDATISLIEFEPRDRLNGWVMGDIGGESAGGVPGGEMDGGEDRNVRVFAQDASIACLRGDPS
ncbi:hypothetical protein F2P56_022916 [Juglans regia]|uniref:Uncharacterized protein n=1 Tax=Juglans regia TaxID=51240 RepID=A0A833UV21_JUGRE|nr:hypothetical protein F2P56_022916 [Juglans regia]